MAVAGIGIERDVAEDADLRHLLLDRADGAADQIVGIERFAAVLVAQLGIGIGKQRDAGDGELRRPARRRAPPDRSRAARRPASRHRNPRLRPVDQEQRPDQIVRGEDVLAHHAPRPLGLPVAARAGGEVEPLDRPGFDRGEAGFDRTAVLDGHCGAPCLIGPCLIGPKSCRPFLTVPRKARQRRGCGAGPALSPRGAAVGGSAEGTRGFAGRAGLVQDAAGIHHQRDLACRPSAPISRRRRLTQQATRPDRLHPLFRRLLHRHHRPDRRDHRARAVRICRSAAGDGLSIPDLHHLDRQRGIG